MKHYMNSLKNRRPVLLLVQPGSHLAPGEDQETLRRVGQRPPGDDGDHRHVLPGPTGFAEKLSMFLLGLQGVSSGFFFCFEALLQVFCGFLVCVFDVKFSTSMQCFVCFLFVFGSFEVKFSHEFSTIYQCVVVSTMHQCFVFFDVKFSTMYQWFVDFSMLGFLLYTSVV